MIARRQLVLQRVEDHHHPRLAHARGAACARGAAPGARRRRRRRRAACARRRRRASAAGRRRSRPSARSRSSAWSRRMKRSSGAGSSRTQIGGRSTGGAGVHPTRAGTGPPDTVPARAGLHSSASPPRGSPTRRRAWWPGFLALFTLPLYTHHLTKAQLGYAETLLTAIILASIVLRFGVGEAFVRFYFDDDDAARRDRLARAHDVLRARHHHRRALVAVRPSPGRCRRRCWARATRR